ncbi:MAG: DUF1015 family protein [Candidatus Accumulibacter necessarius]|uniref:DUF1015 family protein n=1 Tax=Candidatus Accumulibacter necessarius TaxID=2954386 RepID=UPI002FC2E097
MPACVRAAQDAAAVAAPPYDVLSSAEARQAAIGKPLSFLHVSKAEIDLPPRSITIAPEVYASRPKFSAPDRRAGCLP